MEKRPLLRAVIGMSVLTMALGLVATTPAVAKDGDVIVRGDCTGRADWKLKLGPRDGRIELEYEVDSNRAGQVWRVRIKDNGVLRFKGRRTTQAPSGSFTVDIRIPDMAGTDRVVARARNVTSGQVCRGVATL